MPKKSIQDKCNELAEQMYKHRAAKDRYREEYNYPAAAEQEEKEIQLKEKLTKLMKLLPKNKS